MKIEEAELKYSHRWLKLQNAVWDSNAVLLEGTIVDICDIDGLELEERNNDETNGFVWWYTSPNDLDNFIERTIVELCVY